MMTTLPRSSRHTSHTSQLPVLEVKPLKKYTSINKLVVVSPELKLTTKRRPCGELRDNTNYASPQSERTDVTNKLYRRREDNSCDNNNNHDVRDKCNSLPQPAKLSEVSPPPQALSRIPRPRQLKTFHLPPSLDDGTGVVTSPRDNTSPADSATTTPRSRHTGTPLSELDSTTTTPRSRRIGTSLSELDSAATTPRSKRTGTPLSELDRKWALQQCEVLTTWTSDTLKRNGRRLNTDLKKAISDGITLPILVDIAYDTDLIIQLGRSGSADEKLSEEEILTSLTRSLDIIRDRDANYLADITPHDLVSGDLKSILLVLSELKDTMGQDKSKLTSSKSHDDETQLVSKKGKSGEVTTDSIPVPTDSTSQNGSNIQTITIKPAHQPSMKHAKRPEDTTQQKQQVLSTFKLPLASTEAPKISRSRQRRTGIIKQAASLDCLDDRKPQWDSQHNAQHNVNHSLDSRSGRNKATTASEGVIRRSLSTVSINVDSGEKEYHFEEEDSCLPPPSPRSSSNHNTISDPRLSIDVTSSQDSNMYHHNINHSTQASAFYKPALITTASETRIKSQRERNKNYASHSSLLVRGQPSGDSNPTTPCAQPEYERLRVAKQQYTTPNYQQQQLHQQQYNQQSQQKTQQANNTSHVQQPPPSYQPRSNPNYNRRHVDKPTSPPEYKRSTDINRNEYGEVHRAEPVSNSQRIYPDPLYATRQDSAVITSASTDSQHLHPSDNIQSYDRSPKQTKRKPSPRYPNTNTSTEPHGHNNQSKDYSDPYDAINNLDSLEAGFSVISPVHSSSETRTLSPGSPRSSQNSGTDRQVLQPEKSVLSSESKYENLTDAQRKRLSMPTGVNYYEKSGSQANKHSKSHRNGNTGYDSPQEDDPPVQNGHCLDNAMMESSIYDNNRSETPSLPLLTDNTDIESVSDMLHGGVRYQRSASVCDKMMFTKEDPNMPSNEEYFLDDLEQEQTDEPPEYKSSGNTRLKKKHSSRSSGRKHKKTSHNSSQSASTTPSTKSASHQRTLEDKISKLEGLFEDLSVYLGVEGVVSSDNKRGSISESATSSQWSYANKISNRKYKNGRSTESKANQKRFQRIESHIITLARSVAHISSEIRSHSTLYVELERLSREVGQIKQVLDTRENANPKILNEPQQSSTPPVPELASGTVLNPPNATTESKDRTQKLNKLTKFFGQEPPMMKVFLKELGYEKYLAQFEAEKIGMVELPYMSEDKLRHIGIPLGPRSRIIQEAQGLQSQLPIMNGLYTPPNSNNTKKSKR